MLDNIIIDTMTELINKSRIFFYRLFGTVIILLFFLSFSLIYNYFQKNGFKDLFLGISILCGKGNFVVSDIYIKGRINSSKEDILEVIKVKRGDELLSVNIEEVKSNLERLPWIKNVIVRRVYPNKIFIIIEEFEAIAIWQNKGIFYPVDKDGKIFGVSVDNFPPLPIITGEEAPSNIYNLFDIISEYPDLKERIKGATFIKKRRWDIYLDDIKEGLIIKLPEEYPEAALKKLIEMQKKYKVFKRKLTLIDLRLPDRIDIKGENGANINIPYLNDSNSKQKKGVNL